jgi:hypothetical protein
MLNNQLFYVKNKDQYPPFKNGLYLEEYFLNYYLNNNINSKRKYIPILWTNFQIENWFNCKKAELQNDLDAWVLQNPSENGYYVVVQHDDNCLLKLPENTVIYGACSGDIPIPLIYQDTTSQLENIPKKTFSEKKVLCSFVGCITANGVSPNVRLVMFNTLYNNPLFRMTNAGGWNASVDKNKQDNFISETINSKFALAPRGYGRSSFRFFEILILGTIPIYLWNDVNWLPFQDTIDYSKLCISLHISKIHLLEDIIKNISENDYDNMLIYYQSIKKYFELPGMTDKIINLNIC